MKYNIKKIENLETIKNLLNNYNDYFEPNLKKLAGDLDLYANKLLNYSNIFGIYDNNDILGFVSFYDNDKKNKIGFLNLIIIDKKYQNIGIGSQLLMHFENTCHKSGMQKLNLEVLKNNQNAINFYKKKGYDFLDENKNSYLMTKEIK